MAIENSERRIYGFQFHPEVMHTEHGMEMIKHFLIGIAAVPADWNMGQVLEEQMAKIKAQVGSCGLMERRCRQSIRSPGRRCWPPKKRACGDVSYASYASCHVAATSGFSFRCVCICAACMCLHS